MKSWHSLLLLVFLFWGKLIAAISLILIVSHNVEGTLSINNVVCQQQYPWNGKVDIDYEIDGDENATNIWIYANGFDKVTNKRVTVRSLTGQGVLEPTKPGKHHLIWDASKDCPDLNAQSFYLTISAMNGKPLYMVIDLSKGPDATSYPISYLSREPDGGWTEEHKTTKLVLRYIFPGSFIMGSPEDELGRGYNETQHKVTLTKSFYMGVFEVTQKQYELITGINPSWSKNDMQPASSVTYDMIRGSSKGANWPTNNEVDDNSFLGVLRKKTSLAFDLPTEAQWEFACRAETTTALNSGKNLTNIEQCPNMDEVGRYGYNGDAYSVVGAYIPNTWGIYDMHGNALEWCLDWCANDLGSASVTDPRGEINGSERVLRGGSYAYIAGCCRSAYRYSSTTDFDYFQYGFRLSITQD